MSGTRRIWQPTSDQTTQPVDNTRNEVVSSSRGQSHRGRGRGRGGRFASQNQRNQGIQTETQEQGQPASSEGLTNEIIQTSTGSSANLRNRSRRRGDGRRNREWNTNSSAEEVQPSVEKETSEESNTVNTKEEEVEQPREPKKQFRPRKEEKKPVFHEKKQELKPIQIVDPQHSTLAADIIDRLNKNTYECIICCDVIKRHATIWSCNNCYMLFHLPCIKKWSRASDGEGAISWRCPGCQYICLMRPVPKCFCGKVTDPPFNAYILPHSCGETCSKMRKGTDCPHPCTMMCHPGFCPPCGSLGPNKTCYCGKESYRLRCGEKDSGKTCGKICGLDLNCGLHKCNQICHRGPCSPCDEVTVQSCYCGSKKEKRKCGTGKLDTSSGEPRYYSCASVCGKPFACGNHKCEEACHPGSCGTCKLLPSKVTTCPCGKIPLVLLTSKVRKSCKEDINTCPNLCERKLACGVHSCKEYCHLGPCPECKEQVRVPCRCHATLTTMSCALANSSQQDPILCNKVCKAMRLCGRHPCGKKCCPSSQQADPSGLDPEGDHICNLICDRKLKCGKHKCDLLCHSGKCPPCHNTLHETYICECGKTTLEPPILCGAKLPVCPYSCVRPRECGHQDNHKCHSRESPCSPCTVLVERWCMGNHEIKKNVPCHMQQVSCGKICGKMLDCGIHKCKRICHSGPCQSSASEISKISPEMSSDRSNSCGQLCGAKLPFCGHPCPIKCHPKEPCPRIPCKQLIHISCPCKRRSVEVECLRGGLEDTIEKGNRELPCDELCAIEDRNRRLAEAFGTGQSSNSIYPDILIQLAKASPSFIVQVEKRLEELVKGNGGKVFFPAMDRIQRRIVHEMAKAYNVDTESYDKEPSRSIIAMKKKDSKIPPILLSSVLSEPPKQQQTGGVVNMHSNNSTPCALHVYDLNPNVKTHHLISFLHPFEGHFQLKWLDDFNALILFKDQTRMRSALYILKGHFQVEQYKDTYEPLEGQEPRDNKSKWRDEHHKVTEYKQPEQPWRENNNYFAALTSVKRTTPPLISNHSSQEEEAMWGQTEDDLKFKKESEFVLKEVRQQTQSIKQEEELKPADLSLDDWENEDKEPTHKDKIEP